MKRIGLSLAAVAACAIIFVNQKAHAENGATATYVESQRVLDNFEKKGGNPLIPGEQYQVQTNRRTANGNIEIHEKETDIFYVTEGSATIIVGGTAIEPKATRAGQMTAKEIENGKSYNLKKGDMLVIPAGQPHWFKQVNGFINYITVKSITP